MLVEWNECCKEFGKIQSFKTLMTQSEIISQWIGNYLYLFEVKVYFENMFQSQTY